MNKYYNNTIENSEIMQMKLADIFKNADTVTSNRRDQTLFIDYFNDGYSVSIKVKKVREPETSDISDEEKEVIQRLAEGQRQIDVAEKMKISQAKVSAIKKRNSALLLTLMTTASTLAAGSAFDFLTSKSLDKKKG